MDGPKSVDKYNSFKATKDPTSIYYGCGKIKPPHTLRKNEYLGEELNEEAPMHLGFNLPLKEIVTSTTVDLAEVVLCSPLEHIEESTSNSADKTTDL